MSYTGSVSVLPRAGAQAPLFTFVNCPPLVRHGGGHRDCQIARHSLPICSRHHPQVPPPLAECDKRETRNFLSPLCQTKSWSHAGKTRGGNGGCRAVGMASSATQAGLRPLGMGLTPFPSGMDNKWRRLFWSKGEKERPSPAFHWPGLLRMNHPGKRPGAAWLPPTAGQALCSTHCASSPFIFPTTPWLDLITFPNLSRRLRQVRQLSQFSWPVGGSHGIQLRSGWLKNTCLWPLQTFQRAEMERAWIWGRAPPSGRALSWPWAGPGHHAPDTGLTCTRDLIFLLSTNSDSGFSDLSTAPVIVLVLQIPPGTELSEGPENSAGDQSSKVKGPPRQSLWKQPTCSCSPLTAGIVPVRENRIEKTACVPGTAHQLRTRAVFFQILSSLPSILPVNLMPEKEYWMQS